MTTLDTLKEVFERELNRPLPEFSLQMTPEQVQEWNSVAHISLILGIEQAFGFQFSTEELGQLENVAAIHAVVEAKRQLAPTA